MGTVEYIMRDDDGKPYRQQYQFNTTEELADAIDTTKLLTVDEIVDVILDDMEIQDMADLAALSFDDLILFHSSVGGDIRNTFGLWIENNPNIIDHPDDTSMEILSRCWKLVRKDATNASQKMTF